MTLGRVLNIQLAFVSQQNRMWINDKLHSALHSALTPLISIDSKKIFKIVRALSLVDRCD